MSWVEFLTWQTHAMQRMWRRQVRAVNDRMRQQYEEARRREGGAR